MIIHLEQALYQSLSDTEKSIIHYIKLFFTRA